MGKLQEKRAVATLENSGEALGTSRCFSVICVVSRQGSILLIIALPLEHREHVPLHYLSCLQDVNLMESNPQRLHGLLDM